MRSRTRASSAASAGVRPRAVKEAIAGEAGCEAPWCEWASLQRDLVCVRCEYSPCER